MKKLTIDLIHSKTKTDNLNKIENLNLWGIDLEDVSILNNMPNLENLSLSVNKIKTLKSFSNCLKLKQLYLRNNYINDLKEIKYLKNLNNLEILWLSENPICKLNNYRNHVIKTLPFLKKLDNKDITNDERLNIDKVVPESNYDLEPKVKEYTYDKKKKLINKNSYKNKNNYIENENYVFKGNHLKRSNTNINKENYESYNKNYNNNSNNSKNNDEKYKILNNNYINHKENEEENFYYQKFKPSVKKNYDSYSEEEIDNNIRNKKSNNKETEVIEKENVITAILMLLNDLNKIELEVIKNEINKKLNDN